MKKTLVSIITMSGVSFITAMLLLKLFKSNPNISIQRPKANDTSAIDSVNRVITDTFVAINRFTIEDTILHEVNSTQEYLTKQKVKSIDVLDFHYTTLKELYKIKGLSTATNRLLRKTIVSVNQHRQQIISRDNLKPKPQKSRKDTLSVPRSDSTDVLNDSLLKNSQKID